MSGHSKWKNIMHKKEKTDKQRASVFTKIGREIVLAVKNGGPDPESNGRLKDIILKAKANNVPNDNIERCIKKASGEGENVNYEEITYEGYGPAGIAVIVEAVTENRNRTAADVRHYFDKFGGNLGQTGSVNWQFTKKGVIVIDKEEYSEEKLMDDVLELDAEDYVVEEEVYEIYTAPENLSAVCEALEQKGYTFLSAEAEMVPSTYIALTDEDQIKNMQKLLDHLEENDDVQNVWHNWDEQ
ncbi:MAG: YebC/PmpR family DNA-binding transcriptional regulator [Clostridia bacterium]|nr:YebC/PmpR family DNA-binding transcriptional regulator [Clostridia bacterium]MBQ2720325.1 YebC/PmpR family DNA-binding transcriptional regulator [Clostridia bacterium]MBQ4627505.1 YebC/PmpR family DNA-binding transcriptional regulator [Clostridia bacterium]